MRDNFYQRLFHEAEDYWLPRGFELSHDFLPNDIDLKWENVKQWTELERKDIHFHRFLKNSGRLLWSATDAFWSRSCSHMIEAQLLVIGEEHGRHTGWLGMISSASLDGAIDLWRSAKKSPAADHLHKELYSIPGWEDYDNMIPGRTSYEQYGFTMMLSFELIRRLVAFIKDRHREIPRYIGGALRLGGTDRARREIAMLFEALELRPLSRSSVIEALWNSRLDKRLYLDYLTHQERGLTLDDAMGL